MAKKTDNGTVISVKVNPALKADFLLLADLNGLDISGYVRRILQAVADNQKDLIDKARDLNSRFSAEKSKLATDDFNFLAKQALAQVLGSDSDD